MSSLPLEPFRTGAEKDRVMYQQSVVPQIDGVSASPWDRRWWHGHTAQPTQPSPLTTTRSNPSHGPRQVSPARCLILVVDDHYEIRVALAELLEDEGYQVITAAHGQEALALLRRGTVRPNLIVLDLMMPIMDGWTFREIQASDPALQAIPVVVISAISNVQQQRHPVPAAAYLPKPLNFALLLETVTRSCCPT
jgi:CheY-like chemotaxis protein